MSRDKNVIYIASNKYAMSDGWQKVGISDRGAEERVRDTPQTTHKEKYTLQYYRSTPLYKKLEKHIHDHFQNDLRILELS